MSAFTPNPKTEKIEFVHVDDDGFENVYQLPGVFEACGRCRGRGTHDHPAFSNGFTQSEMDEAGPEFREDYMNGVYDVRCEVCNGARVVLVIDEAAAERQIPGIMAKVEEQRELEYQWERERAAELRWGY